jgi:F-type H+-transporting ATPase subunit b
LAVTDQIQAHAGVAEQHEEPSAFGLEPGGYVALSMLVVLVILLVARVPAAIGRALDQRIATIRAQLDEASRLRAEAEALKAEYEAKARDSDREIAELHAAAERQAGQIVAQAKADAEALVARHQAMAEDKIAAAERHAVEEVRARAATAAAAAAARIIAEQMPGEADRSLIDSTIESLGKAH